MTSGYPPYRRQSSLPLLLAGAAFILTAWLVGDRMGLFSSGPGGEPRAITPRGDLADYEKDVIRIFEESAPSVVHITTVREVRGYLGDTRSYPEGSGSGFLWDPDGTVITNFHVIESALKSRSRDLVVAVGAETYKATVLNALPTYDIAVLQVMGAPRNLRPLPLGTSADLKVGQFVVAIGNPFGLDQTLTTGVVSALNRTIRTKSNTLSGLIQIDADINPGNSGGPLLDSAGRLIGMNTAIYSPSGVSAGIGFSVPVDIINEIVPELIAGKQTQRVLGIEAEDLRMQLPPDSGYAQGVLVREVTPGEGADTAGLRPYERRGSDEIVDIIVELEGRLVPTLAELRRLLRGRAEGARVRVKFLRGVWPDQLQPMELMITVR